MNVCGLREAGRAPALWAASSVVAALYGTTHFRRKRKLLLFRIIDFNKLHYSIINANFPNQ